MTALQRLTLRASEIRQRLNEITGIEGEAFTDEIRQESDRLTTEFREVETKLRAATVAGDGDPPEDLPAGSGDPEIRERAALVQRCDVGAIFAAAFERRATAGAEAELQSELSLNANQIPLELLRREPEIRTTVTTAPTDTGAAQQPIIPPVFPDSVAAFLGIETPTVPAGDAVFPVLTTRPTVGGPHDDSTSVDHTNATFDGDALSPERLQASFFYRRTDAARFAGMGESLRMALFEGLMDAMDAQIVAGDEGLLEGTNLANHNAAAVTTFANYVSEFGYSRVDGRFASMASDLRIVMGSGTYAHAGSRYRGNNSEETALDRLMRSTGGIRVSAHVPAVSGNKQNAIIRRGHCRALRPCVRRRDGGGSGGVHAGAAAVSAADHRPGADSPRRVCVRDRCRSRKRAHAHAHAGRDVERDGLGGVLALPGGPKRALRNPNGGSGGDFGAPSALCRGSGATVARARSDSVRQHRRPAGRGD